MTTRTAERIDEWESRPFDGGYAALQDLADASFSGVVTAGRAQCCLLNGTVVGILDGSIEDFEDATGTIRKAPSPALPLLLIMQERGDSVRAKYYSEETPLSEADQKLSDGGFTGYVELSENVLSGDYYVVYHGGRSMSVAYVGQSDQLLTDDEAFERADDEVGIYKVYPVDIDPIEIPEPESDDEPDAMAAGTDDTETAPAATESADSTESDDAPEQSTGAGEQSEPETDSSAGRERTDASPADDREDATAGIARRESTQAEESPTETETATRREGAGDPSPETTEHSESAAGDSPGSRSERESRPTRTDEGQPESQRTEQSPSRTDPRREDQPRQGEQTREPTAQRGQTREPASGDRTEDTHSVREGEEPQPRSGSGRDPDPIGGDPLSDASQPSEASGDLERRSIPSVDPDQTWGGDEDGPGSTPDAASGVDVDIGQQIESAERSASDQSRREQSSPAAGDPARGTAQQSAGSPERVTSETRAAPSAELREKEERIEALEADLDDLAAERDRLLSENEDLEADLEAVREERDELQAEVNRLQSRIEELEAAEDTGSDDADLQLSPTEAIEKTNLFVRYGSKGDATLEAAHDGEADKDAVASNLDLEYHTAFDAETAAVGDLTFEDFLTDTLQYRFVDWVVHDLLYEIRDTGHADALRDLFDALPSLDRVELNGSVSVTYTENGEEHREQEQFDVVLRDRMGNPIAVASINDSREAATDDMMTDLVTRSTRAGESHDTLVGAFFLTASFFDPDALETASEATGGGLLSRDKRESFVRLGRKQGYHLCLVEAREGKFHLAVPEL